MRKSKKIASFLLFTSLFLGQFGVQVTKAEEIKKGYAYKNGKAYVIEVKGKETKVSEAGSNNKISLETHQEDRLVVRVGEGIEEKFFCIDKEGKQYGEEYDDMGDFKEGLVRVGKKIKKNEELEYRYGVMDKNGEIVVPIKYLWVNDISNGILTVTEGKGEADPDSKMGAVNQNGAVVIPTQYEYISPFNQYGIAIMQKDMEDDLLKKGFINRKGEIVVEPQYTLIEAIEGTKLYKIGKETSDDFSLGIMNQKGELIVPNEYSEVSVYEDLKRIVLTNKNKNKVRMIDFDGNNILPFYVNDISEKQPDGVFFIRKGEKDGIRFALIDATGRELYPFTLFTYDNFEHGLARVSKGENYDQWGLIDKQGKEIVPCKNDYIFPFEEGMATFKDKKGNYGFYDTKGNISLKLGKKYEEVGYFADGLCPVKQKGKYGYINKKGKLVIPCKFDEVDDFIRGLARIYKTDQFGNRRIGLINKKGKQVTPVHYSDIEYKDTGEIKVGIKDNYFTKYGFLDKKGKMILPPNYSDAYSYHGNVGIVSIVKFNGEVKFGLANKSGKLDKTIRFDNIFTPYKGMFKTVKEDKNGAIKNGMMDAKGKELLKPIYEIDNYWENGSDLAVISKNGKKGLINEKGKIILPIKYDIIYHTDNGAIIFSEQNKEEYRYGLLNKKGKIILKPKYSYIEGFREDDYAVAEVRKKQGLIDKNGKVYIPFKYDSLERQSKNLYLAKKDKKIGFLDRDGKVIVPIEFDFVFLK